MISRPANEIGSRLVIPFGPFVRSVGWSRKGRSSRIALFVIVTKIWPKKSVTIAR